MYKILIIEDEKLLADSIQSVLERKGFEVECVYDGETGAEYAELGIYDLLILDVMMPKMNGCQVAREVRAKRCGTPILMLTARSELEDRIEGLNAGADYYLTKPFDIRELLACINALLRRQGPQVDQVTLGNTALDLGACTLICGEKRVQLSAREFDVMRILLRSQSTILSKEVILARVWGYDSDAVENHVEVYVGFLRKSCTASVPISASRQSGGWAIVWRWMRNAETSAPSICRGHHGDRHHHVVYGLWNALFFYTEQPGAGKLCHDARRSGRYHGP